MTTKNNKQIEIIDEISPEISFQKDSFETKEEFYERLNTYFKNLFLAGHGEYTPDGYNVNTETYILDVNWNDWLIERKINGIHSGQFILNRIGRKFAKTLYESQQTYNIYVTLEIQDKAADDYSLNEQIKTSRVFLQTTKGYTHIHPLNDQEAIYEKLIGQNERIYQERNKIFTDFQDCYKTSEKLLNENNVINKDYFDSYKKITTDYEKTNDGLSKLNLSFPDAKSFQFNLVDIDMLELKEDIITNISKLKISIDEDDEKDFHYAKINNTIQSYQNYIDKSISQSFSGDAKKAINELKRQSEKFYQAIALSISLLLILGFIVIIFS